MRWVIGAFLVIALCSPVSWSQEDTDVLLRVSPEPFDLETDTQTVEPTDTETDKQTSESPAQEIRFKWTGGAGEANERAPSSNLRGFDLNAAPGEQGRSGPALKRSEQTYSRNALRQALDIAPGDMPEKNGCERRDNGFGKSSGTCVYTKSVTTVNGRRKADAQYRNPTVNGMPLDKSNGEARKFCELEGYRTGRVAAIGSRADETVRASGVAACSGGACIAAGRVECFG